MKKEFYPIPTLRWRRSPLQNILQLEALWLGLRFYWEEEIESLYANKLNWKTRIVRIIFCVDL
jgi:hypothetical protein